MTEHLSRLTLTLEVDAPLERARVATLGPHLHGVLMESIPADYVQTLHTVPVNPYSQYALARSTTSLEWKISTLTNEARQQIVRTYQRRGVCGFSAPCERDSDTGHVAIAGAEPAKSIRAHFLRAARDAQVPGRVPDAYRIQAIRRVRVLAGSAARVSESRAEVRCNCRRRRARSWPHRRIRSVGSPLRVPGGVGPVRGGRGACSRLHRLGHVHRPRCGYFASYIAALLWFGEFSGCGIKASMGMGAIRVQPLAPREKCVPKP